MCKYYKGSDAQPESLNFVNDGKETLNRGRGIGSVEGNVQEVIFKLNEGHK